MCAKGRERSRYVVERGTFGTTPVTGANAASRLFVGSASFTEVRSVIRAWASSSVPKTWSTERGEYTGPGVDAYGYVRGTRRHIADDTRFLYDDGDTTEQIEARIAEAEEDYHRRHYVTRAQASQGGQKADAGGSKGGKASQGGRKGPVAEAAAAVDEARASGDRKALAKARSSFEGVVRSQRKSRLRRAAKRKGTPRRYLGGRGVLSARLSARFGLKGRGSAWDAAARADANAVRNGRWFSTGLRHRLFMRTVGRVVRSDSAVARRAAIRQTGRAVRRSYIRQYGFRRGIRAARKRTRAALAREKARRRRLASRRAQRAMESRMRTRLGRRLVRHHYRNARYRRAMRARGFGRLRARRHVRGWGRSVNRAERRSMRRYRVRGGRNASTARLLAGTFALGSFRAVRGAARLVGRAARTPAGIARRASGRTTAQRSAAFRRASSSGRSRSTYSSYATASGMRRATGGRSPKGRRSSWTKPHKR